VRDTARYAPEPACIDPMRPLTVAGAAQVGSVLAARRFLLPVELRHANHTASTNAFILEGNAHRFRVKPYNGRV